MKDSTITMWTCQTDIVLDVIDRDGVSYVKREFIDKKYQETAWIFKEAYKFFAAEGQRILPKPPEAESPVWMYHDSMWATMAVGCTLLKLEVPKDEIITFDLRNWQKILNMDFLGTDAEIAKFEQELRRQGIKDNLEVVKSPFYPLVKKELIGSWKKLFTDQPDNPTYMQGATWRLKKEWIAERITQQA